MKKIFLLFSLPVTLLLTGCFETTQEITLNEDGSGTVSSTNDMSAVIGLVKEMGSKDAGKTGDMATIDTTIALSSQVDSIANLTPEEKELLKKGTMHLNLNLKDDKLITNIRFPFKTPSEVKAYNELTTKVMAEAMKKQMGGSQMGGMENMPAPSSTEDYFSTRFSNGLLVKTLNKEKYAGAENDEYLKGMKESAGMGLPMTVTYVINLPRPAKKVEGKNVKLSEDKRKVTIKTDIDDFFDDPAKMEFRIEY
jgi:hypothetical protein